MRPKKNGVQYRRARACPSPLSAQSNAREGQAPALREHRDQDVSPTVLHRDREVSPTGKPEFRSHRLPRGSIFNHIFDVKSPVFRLRDVDIANGME